MIPFVLIVRVLRGARSSLPKPLPAGTIPLVVIGALSKAVGEVIGYAGLQWPSLEARLIDIEIHKVQYASRGER